MSEVDVSDFLMQMFQGLIYLKNCSGSMYRDLKPKNIAVFQNMHYAIIDSAEFKYMDTTNLSLYIKELKGKYIS